jgi:hypothetical protein
MFFDKGIYCCIFIIFLKASFYNIQKIEGVLNYAKHNIINSPTP